MLNKRMIGQRRSYAYFVKGMGEYMTSFEVVKYADAKIELLFEGEFASVVEMRKLEGEYIQNTESCVNKCIAGRTYQEWRHTYRDRIKQQQKEYHEKHADEFKEKRKQYYENHADEIKEQKKAYYKKNADEIKEKRKEYREKYGDKIKEKKNTKVTCEVCGVIYTYGNRAVHCRSKRHQAKIEKEPEEEDSINR
jgi:hypothetical protein